jgi:two-component system, OmpR family, phosphate regulon response regulator PhoB
VILRPRILVVEDEPAIAELMSYSLRQSGYEPVTLGTAELAMQSINQTLPALILLDVMLPGMSGFDLARRLRGDGRTRELPIIMVTARGEESDRVGGLEIGADDYISKPFSPRELVARVRAVLRRRAPHQVGDVIEIGPVRLDPAAHTVSINGETVNFGPTEFQLLRFFMTTPNRVFSRDQLLNALRGDHTFLEDRTVDVYIRRLRAGLGEFGETLIETVRGAGYKLTPPSK